MRGCICECTALCHYKTLSFSHCAVRASAWVALRDCPLLVLLKVRVYVSKQTRAHICFPGCHGVGPVRMGLLTAATLAGALVPGVCSLVGALQGLRGCSKPPVLRTTPIAMPDYERRRFLGSDRQAFRSPGAAISALRAHAAPV